MIHRHSEIPPDTPARALPRVALVDLLERGDLQAWLPLARAIQGDPTGELAITVMRLIDAYPMYGTSALWRAWIDLCQARTLVDTRPASLASLRRQRGLTQAQVAVRLGMSQSDVSRPSQAPNGADSVLGPCPIIPLAAHIDTNAEHRECRFCRPGITRRRLSSAGWVSRRLSATIRPR